MYLSNQNYVLYYNYILNKIHWLILVKRGSTEKKLGLREFIGKKYDKIFLKLWDMGWRIDPLSHLIPET